MSFKDLSKLDVGARTQKFLIAFGALQIILSFLIIVSGVSSSGGSYPPYPYPAPPPPPQTVSSYNSFEDKIVEKVTQEYKQV